MRFTSLAAILCMAGFTAVAGDGTSSANARQSRRGERHTQSRAAAASIMTAKRMAFMALRKRMVFYSRLAAADHSGIYMPNPTAHAASASYPALHDALAAGA